jgi:hypothetical protein
MYRLGEPEGLERLLDQYKRRCQMAGIAQQMAIVDDTLKEDTATWLDKAEETRGEIINYVNERARTAHDAGMRHAG